MSLTGDVAMEVEGQKKRCDAENRGRVMCFEDRGRNHDQKSQVAVKAGKSKEMDSSWSLQKNPDYALIFAQ